MVGRERGVKQLGIGKNSYYFFNLYGLEIKSSKNWGRFIFDDSTIINTEQLKSLVENEYNEVVSNRINRELKGHSILLVRKFGLTPADLQDRRNKEMKAHLRAKEVASYIFFVFFKLSGFRYGISLDSELYRSSGFNSSYLDSLGTIGDRKRNVGYEYIIELPKKLFVFRKAELKTIFKRPMFNKLYEIIIHRNKSNKNIRDSLLNYYLSVNTPSPTTQFIGSISSLEILLKYKSSYSQFLKRKKFLLSEKLKEKFINLDSYITNRHEVVHSATSVDIKILHLPMYLYCYILPLYLELFENFGSTVQVINFIDLIIQEEKLKRNNYNHYKLKLDKIKTKFEYLTDYNILNTIGIYNPNNPEKYNKDILEMTYFLSKYNEMPIENIYMVLVKHYLIRSPFNDIKEFLSEFEKELHTFKERVERAVREKWYS